MKVFNIRNEMVYINLNKYRVNWDSSCKSNFQFVIKKFLETYWRNHIVVEEMRIPGTRLTLDMVNFTMRVIVETQGDQHRQFNKFFHKDSRVQYLNGLKRDGLKIKWAELNNLIFVEIYKEDISNLNSVWFKTKFGIVL